MFNENSINLKIRRYSKTILSLFIIMVSFINIAFASDGNMSYEEYMTYFVISAVIGFILTWGGGLLIPFLIRYKIVKAPLKKKSAILVAVVWFLAQYIFWTTILISQSKTHFALYLVSFASYYILIKENKVKKNQIHNNNELIAEELNNIPPKI